MPQRHKIQFGTFHVTTNARDHIGWCILPGAAQMIIDNLCMTRNKHRARLFAFCVLPDHMHLIISPGDKGLSQFMHSFKKNSSRDIFEYLGKNSDFRIAAAENTEITETNGNGTVHNNIRSSGSITAAPRKNICMTGWQKGYHDEYIRDERQLSAAINYVIGNAKKHGLVDEISKWPWTSLHFPKLIDPLGLWI